VKRLKRDRGAACSAQLRERPKAFLINGLKREELVATKLHDPA